MHKGVIKNEKVLCSISEQLLLFLHFYIKENAGRRSKIPPGIDGSQLQVGAPKRRVLYLRCKQTPGWEIQMKEQKRYEYKRKHAAVCKRQTGIL